MDASGPRTVRSVSSRASIRPWSAGGGARSRPKRARGARRVDGVGRQKGAMPPGPSTGTGPRHSQKVDEAPQPIWVTGTMRMVGLHRGYRSDAGAVESPIEDLFAMMIVVVIIVLFVTSLTSIYEIKSDQDRRSDIWDRCLSFSTTILNHPMLLENSFAEEGFFSGEKLLKIKEAYEQQSAGAPPAEGEEDDPFTMFNDSLTSESEFGWELYFQDTSDYGSRADFVFSLRSGEALAFEAQSMVWTVDIYVDVDEIHVARLTVLVLEV
jgi:hypothetical protein